MIKFITPLALFASLLISSVSQAQTPSSYKIDPLTDIAPLNTVVTIEIEVEQNMVKAGPYARYAQKMLGVVAPLSDKSAYSIVDAKIGYIDPTQSSQPLSSVVPCSAATSAQESVYDPFNLITSDRMESRSLSQEDMAREAANKIFTLRKRRFDLISGEAGEYVFGEGLGAALDEMRALEASLLQLFVGVKSVERSSYSFKVTPTAESNSYVVARFSQSGGILPLSDLSGLPVMLVLTPNNLIEPVDVNPKKFDQITYYQVAAPTKCQLMQSTVEVASTEIPVLQFGVKIGIGLNDK